MSRFTKAQKILMCLIGFFLALGLLFQGLRQSSISDIGYSAVSYLKYGLIDYPLTSIKNFSSDFANLWKVKDENDTLREELSMTTNYQALYENAQRENEELRELLNMNESLTGFNRISAKVIGRDSTYWNDQVTLNVGANDGIEEDMVVMNSQGVIGKIQKVQDSTSVVKLLTCEDKNNKVAVRINLGNNEDQSEGDSSEADQQEQDQQQERASSVEGILESYDTNEQAYVVSLLDDQEVEEGMQVVTSGKGGVYPTVRRNGEKSRNAGQSAGAGHLCRAGLQLPVF